MSLRFIRFLPVALISGLAIALLVTKSDGLWLNESFGDGSLLGLVVLPFAVIAIARYFRYDIASPAVLFAFVWTLSLAVAQLPFYNAPGWTATAWMALTVAPLALTVGAIIATGNSAVNRKPIPIKLTTDETDKLAGVLTVLMAIGSVVLLYSFKLIGTVPILSPSIDATRFSDAVHPFIELVTRLVPMCTVLATVAAALTKHRRALFAGMAAWGTVLLIAQAGRLHVVTPAVVAITILYIARGLKGRRLVLAALAMIGLLMLSSFVFFQRTQQHRDFPFEAYLYDVLETRPDVLVALTPTQIALSSSIHTFARLADTGALERNPDSGLYSLHGLDRYIQAKDSEEVGRRIVGALWTGTYLADIYGDWGLLGASIWSFICGLIYGLAYRMAVTRRSPDMIFIYSYMTFWLVFFIYVNVWTYYIFWAVDILILWLIVRKVWDLTSDESTVPADRGLLAASV